MNQYLLFSHILLAFLLLSVSPMNVATDQFGDNKIRRKVPYPPPLPLIPCPPAPPGVEMVPKCETPTIDELRKKYLQSEGVTNRGLNFYYYADAIFEKHRFYDTDVVDQANYSLDTRTMFDELGPPDYQKTVLKENETMELYAYIFDHKSSKDYVMTVYTSNGLIYRRGFSQTELVIDDGWKPFIRN